MSSVLITGATKNTGYAIAKKFAQNGFEVAITSRDEKRAQLVSEQLSLETGMRVLGYALDLTSVADIDSVFTKVYHDFKRLDTFVANSANLGVDYDMLNITERDYDGVLDVNLKGTFFCCQRAAQIMKAQDGGAIVLIGSVHAKKTIWGRSLYAASKGGLEALTKSMAIEFGPYNVRTNCIIAGSIRTDRWKNFSDEEISAKRKNWPIGMESTGEDIANGVFYLGTDLSRTVTGTDLTIDSGILASLLPFNGGEHA